MSQQISDRFGAPDADASTEKPSCPEPKEERTEPVKQTQESASSCTSSQVVGHDAIIEQVSTTDKREAGAQQMQAHRDEDVQRAIQATSTLACCRAAEPLSWSKAIQLLRGIPGISERAAQGILAEIGLDMRQFPSARHFASWAGVCPGNNESGGKRFSGKTRQGNPWLRRLLVQAAHAAAHCKNSYLATQYRRIASRRGAKRAAMAIAHSILVIIYHVLLEQKPYHDLGSNFFDERDRQAVEKGLVRRLERLGYRVDLQPLPLPDLQPLPQVG